MVKYKTDDREVPGSIPGRCNTFVCLFFCSSHFSVFFFVLFFFVFFSFFDKKTESKGIHMLCDNMSSLKMRGL